MGRSVIVQMPGSKVTAEEWARIFGNEFYRKALNQQEREKKAASMRDSRRQWEKNRAQPGQYNCDALPLILDDRPFGSKGVYSHCLGERVMSRAHQKQITRETGLVPTN